VHFLLNSDTKMALVLGVNGTQVSPEHDYKKLDAHYARWPTSGFESKGYDAAYENVPPQAEAELAATLLDSNRRIARMM
jgi:hypothetical protein